MVGQDFTDRLDAIVQDLQTKGKGQTVNIMFRNSDNTPNVLPLSSDAQGVVNQAQLDAIQAFVSTLSDTADEYSFAYAPVQAALDAFKEAQTPHEALMTAAATARKNLSDALEADADYQTAKTALETARENPAYVSSREAYVSQHVSENYAELQAAKGKYI